ncbi:MAG: hypothetical protein WB996_08020, partial [Ignavibacteriaceae bacterium]
VFILIGTIHHHRYDLNPKNAVSQQTDSTGASDLNTDFFTICSLHQFSQTIANKSYRSSDFIQTLSCIEAKVLLAKIKIPVQELYNKTSPRAPPIIHS